MRFAFGKILIIVVGGAFLVGCGSQDTPATTSDKASEAKAQPADGCPFTSDDLAKATSLKWELGEELKNHPLETSEAIKATVCLYTAADAPQQGSDPLALRADVVTGADAATVRKDFTRSCTENGGNVRNSTAADGAAVCDRDGSVVEGVAGGDDRIVSVYFVNADKATATKLTPSFEKVLAAVS